MHQQTRHMTEQKLRDYSADHIYYELFMLFETAARLRHDPSIEGDWVVTSALIEAFTIHARALACFLYPGELARHRPATDITADDYVADGAMWRDARGRPPRTLIDVVDRTGKEIAHLTTGRKPAGSPLKQWSPEPILQALFGPLKVFARHARADSLDLSVTAFIAALPDSPSETEGRSVAAPTDLTTERHSGITHVSTTDVPAPIDLRKGDAS